mmetsp:Transcript_65522/g.147751  ORF Transcript_65522/g.147751 Transcript_65522/m.147751 type:complete len:96 (+) Transcript_65522:80-367(+)
MAGRSPHALRALVLVAALAVATWVVGPVFVPPPSTRVPQSPVSAAVVAGGVVPLLQAQPAFAEDGGSGIEIVGYLTLALLVFFLVQALNGQNKGF